MLTPGGRLQFADMVRREELPAGLAASLDAWSDGIGGVLPVRELGARLEAVGFLQVTCKGTTGVSTSDFTIGS